MQDKEFDALLAAAWQLQVWEPSHPAPPHHMPDLATPTAWRSMRLVLGASDGSP